MSESPVKGARLNKRQRRRRAEKEEEARQDAVQAALVYDPANPEVRPDDAWHLVARERGPHGTRDPRTRRKRASRSNPLVLRLPKVFGEPRHIFPPRNITACEPQPTSSRGTVRDVTSEPRPSTSRGSIATPPRRPWGLRLNPSTPLPLPRSLFPTETTTKDSPPRDPSPILTPSVPLNISLVAAATPVHVDVSSREESNDDDVLFLAADGSPESFSPSLLGSPPAKRFRPVDGSYRRNLFD